MPKYQNTLLYLRNQHKIKAVLGVEKLNRIKDSIKAVMNSDKQIDPQQIDGSEYDIIMINDISGIDSMIVFYIIKSDFNVYKIAFKEFI